MNVKRKRVSETPMIKETKDTDQTQDTETAEI